MSDVANPTGGTVPSPQPVPVASVAPVAAPSVPPAGAGMAGGTAPIARPAVGAPPASGVEVDLSNELTWESGGRKFSAPLKTLAEFYEKQSQTPVGSPQNDLYQRAMAGDNSARQQIIQQFYGQQSAQPAAQPQQPDASEKFEVPKEQWEQVQDFFSQMRTEKIKTGMAERMKALKMQAFTRRPNAVDEALAAVSQTMTLYGDRQLSPQESSQIINNVLGELERREAEYQKSLLAGMSPNAGSLGVHEPFRGGLPPVTIQERPDFKKPEYNTFINERFQRALMADRISREGGSAGG